MPKLPDSRFHQHLDACSQCADHPFELCAIGAKLLQEEAQDLKGLEQLSELIQKKELKT